MSTIIIGEGLTNDVLSPQYQFQASRENVGQREIERLLGQGKTFGEGPLPAFLRAAAQARNNGAALELLFLQPADDAEDASSGAAMGDRRIGPPVVLVNTCICGIGAAPSDALWALNDSRVILPIRMDRRLLLDFGSANSRVHLFSSSLALGR